MVSKSPPVESTPVIFNSLPDPPYTGSECPQRAKKQIDLMLLALEVLYLGDADPRYPDSSWLLLSIAKELELQTVLKNRVGLWQLRCTNPLRRASGPRRTLSLPEAKALVLVSCNLARRLTVIIRQLTLAHHQLQEKHLSPDHHFRLADYLQRFRAHFRSRMNPRRAAIATYYSTDDQLNTLALSLLSQLLLCTGTAGTQRLWISLFDGEVA